MNSCTQPQAQPVLRLETDANLFRQNTAAGKREENTKCEKGRHSFFIKEGKNWTQRRLKTRGFFRSE